MKRHKNADIYDHYRAHDWLERQHILKVRKAIRAARRAENKRSLAAIAEINQRTEHVADQ